MNAPATTAAPAPVALPAIDFEGARIEWQSAPGMDHGVATTIGHVARALGYANRRKAREVVARNRAQFKDSEARVSTAGTLDGRSRRTEILSPRGVLKFCIYARTPKAFRFHDALIDLLDALGSGDVVPVKRDVYEALVRKDSMNEEAVRLLGNASSDLGRTIACVNTLAGLASKIFEAVKRERADERTATAIDRAGGDLFTGRGALTSDDNAVLAALAMHGPQDGIRPLAKLARLTQKATSLSAADLAARGAIRREVGKIALAPHDGDQGKVIPMGGSAS